MKRQRVQAGKQLLRLSAQNLYGEQKTNLAVAMKRISGLGLVQEQNLKLGEYEGACMYKDCMYTWQKA